MSPLAFRYPENIRFRCERCGLCCGDTATRVRRILLLKNEVYDISRRTSKTISEFADQVEGFEPYVYVMKKKSNGECVFLRDKLCTIYRMRPLICRFYPFELKNMEDGFYHFFYTDECPQIGKGSHLNRGYFETLFKKSVKTVRKN